MIEESRPLVVVPIQTDKAIGTYYYPDANGRILTASAQLSLFLRCSGGVTVTLEWSGATDETTLPAAGDWQDVTLLARTLIGTYGASYVDTTALLILLMPRGRWRIKYVTSDATNSIEFMFSELDGTQIYVFLDPLVSGWIAIIAAATHLEDTEMHTGDRGMFALAVRNDALGTGFTDADGDYSGIAVTSTGAVWTSTTGAVAQSAAVALNPVQIGTEAQVFDGIAFHDAVDADGDVVRPKGSWYGVQYNMLVSQDGALSAQIQEDVVYVAGTAYGVPPMAVRKDTPAAVAIDGSWLPMTANDAGGLWIAQTPGADRYVTGTITVAMGHGDVEINTQNCATVMVEVDAAGAWGGATVYFEGLYPDGVTWDDAPAYPTDPPVRGTVEWVASEGVWIIPCAGFKKIHASAVGVDTTDITIYLQATTADPQTPGQLGIMAEDLASAPGDYGYGVLSVRDDVLSSTTNADGDYQPLKSDEFGALWIAQAPGTDRNVTAVITVVMGGGTVALNTQSCATVMVTVDAAGAWGSAVVYFEGLLPDAATWDDAPAYPTDPPVRLAIDSTTADGTWVIPCAGFQQIRARAVTVDTTALTISLEATTADQQTPGQLGIMAEDLASVSGDYGYAVLAVRRDAAAVGSGSDGDYSSINVDAYGHLRTTDLSYDAPTNALRDLPVTDLSAHRTVGDAPVYIIAASTELVGPALTWTDLGGEIPTMGYTRMTLWFNLDINDSTGIMFRMLCRHTSGGGDYTIPLFRPTTTGAAGTWTVDFEPERFLAFGDVDQKSFITWDISNTIPYVRFQASETVDGGGGASNAHILDACVTYGWAS